MATHHARSDARILRELTRWADDQRGHAPEAPEPPVRLGQGDHTTDWSGEPVNYRHGLLAAIGLALAFAAGALILAVMHAGAGGQSDRDPRPLTSIHPTDPAVTSPAGQGGGQ